MEVSLTDTKAYPYENILLFPDLRSVNQCSLLHWAYSPPYSLSCGGQVFDVGVPHCRDARMQHSPVQCPSILHSRLVICEDFRGYDLLNLRKTAQLFKTITVGSLTTKAEEGYLCCSRTSAVSASPSQSTPRTSWGNGLPSMPTAAYLVAEGISPTTGPGREGKEKTSVS